MPLPSWHELLILQKMSSSSRKQVKEPQQQRADEDEARYRLLLARYSALLEGDEVDSRKLPLISTLLSWLFFPRSFSLSNVFKQLGRPRVLHWGRIMAGSSFRLARALPTLSFAVLLSLVAAVGFTWFWWYLRRNCIWIIYRLLL